MAQQTRAKQTAPKQPQDPYAQRGKTLASQVQRLRGWVGSDPSRAPELADALVALTAHRLIGHQYGAAAVDAQDAVKRAGQLLTAGGPIGPYTDVRDAVRYITAVVHLATLQAAAGASEAAARSLESVRELQAELGRLRIGERLEPQTVVYALISAARSALPGDAAAANAAADAALARLMEAGPAGEAAGYLPLDVERTISDARWAGGHAVEALGHLHAALRHHDALVAGRIADPGRLSPALLERLAEPLYALHRDLADRLIASGEVDLGLVKRRELVDRLRALVKRLGDAARVPLVLSLADLAEDLRAVGRLDEATAAADEADALILERTDAVSTRLHAATARSAVLTSVGRSAEAVDELDKMVSAVEDSSPAHALALSVLAEAMRSSGDPESAAGIEAAVAAEVAELGLAGVARATLRDRARGVLSLGAALISWVPLGPEESYAAATAGRAAVSAERYVDAEREAAEWLAAERAEAHRQEQARQRAAQVEAERREAERLAAAQAAAARAEAERVVAERAAAEEAERARVAEEAERAERKRRREERMEAHRLELERLEAERLESERLAAERAAAEAIESDPAARERAELERLAAELAELELAERNPAETPTGSGPTEPEPADRPTEAGPTEPQPTDWPSEAGPTEPEIPVEYRPDTGAQTWVSPTPEPESEPEPDVTGAQTWVPPTPEPESEPEPDELERAQELWDQARAQGDRRAARAANERVVQILRARSEADATYAPRLRQALQDLASARLRGGDLFGSRAASKEAKAIGRSLGE